MKFTKVPSGRNVNRVNLRITFMGGDADYFDTQFFRVEGVEFKEEIVGEDEQKILTMIEGFKKVSSMIEDGTSYEEVLEKLGKEMAIIYEDIPCDPLTDHQVKCLVDTIEVIGYDENGSIYKKE